MRPVPDSYKEKVAQMLAFPGTRPNDSFVAGNRFAVEILASSAEEKVIYLFAIMMGCADREPQNLWQEYTLSELLQAILKTPLPLSEDDFESLLQIILTLRLSAYGYPYGDLLFEQMQKFHLEAPLNPFWKWCVCRLRQILGFYYNPNYGNYEGSPVPQMQKLAELLGGIEEGIGERGDAWMDAAIADLNSMDAARRALWVSVFAHARKSKESKPKVKWLARAEDLIALVGLDEFSARLQVWLPLFGRDDGWGFVDRQESNDATFKGLVWMASRVQNPAIVRALGGALRGSIGRVGVRSQKVCNATLWALSTRDEVEAVSVIAGVKRGVKHGAILKTIERTLADFAARLHVSPEDLEELSTPDFGIESGGWKRDFDGTALEVNFSTGKAVWNWTSTEGKALKSAPASVKTVFAGELKELKTQAGEVEKLLVTLKERLDLAVRDEKVWSIAAWRERYLLHPVASLVAARVIWEWSEDDAHWLSFMPQLDTEAIPDGARIRLWHPIFHPVEEVLRWRRRLEEHLIQQPWKQAHREVYRLTDAERTTGTYSNRFAAHILKQHQFNALCAARGWKNQLRLMVDATYRPAFKLWSHYSVRAEFWIEGIGENYGVDTNETGTYLRLSSDQVRFYSENAPENHAHAGGGGYSDEHQRAPTLALALEEIPPLVFSETMRDIDLFVGVSSVGNDETWRDGGPQGHFRDYWQRFGFGELEESAKSRADVLSRLLPRLKIRERTRIEGRFLRVEGRLRAYKIHLGSGNILMEPHDQYLCIVPKSSGATEVFLPFEGDRTLALIVSKALLLAEDDTIKDASIQSQIRAS